MRDLNRIYKCERARSKTGSSRPAQRQDSTRRALRESAERVAVFALWERDFTPDGFLGISLEDPDNSVIAYMRRAADPRDCVIVVINFTPVPRYAYRLGAPEGGYYREIFNSDAHIYGGSNCGNGGGAEALAVRASQRMPRVWPALRA